MKTYLIPVDFSDSMNVILDYALFLADDQPTTLFLFHIFPDQLMVPDSSFPTGVDTDAFLSAEYIQELRKQAESNMKDTVQDLKKTIEKKGLKHIHIKSQVSGGDPEWEISEVCHTLEPRLVIMGTRGEGNKGFLEGSMAEKIMVKSHRPVLAVPETTGKIRLKQVMYATSFESGDVESILWINDFLKDHKASIHIAHFRLKSKDEEAALRMDYLKESLDKVKDGHKFQFHLIDSEAKEDSLQTFVRDNEIDLISYIAHKKNIFKNLFSNKIHKKDFFRLELPMLAMPDTNAS